MGPRLLARNTDNNEQHRFLCLFTAVLSSAIGTVNLKVVASSRIRDISAHCAWRFSVHVHDAVIPATENLSVLCLGAAQTALKKD